MKLDFEIKKLISIHNHGSCKNDDRQTFPYCIDTYAIKNDKPIIGNWKVH